MDMLDSDFTTEDEFFRDIVARRKEFIARARKNSAGKKGAKAALDKLEVKLNQLAHIYEGQSDA